jgi:hypothetical protein
VVRTRTRYISLIRALLRQQAYRVPSGRAETFVQRAAALTLLGRLCSTIAPRWRSCATSTPSSRTPTQRSSSSPPTMRAGVVTAGRCFAAPERARLIDNLSTPSIIGELSGLLRFEFRS